jgi:hypothetical protein
METGFITLGSRGEVAKRPFRVASIQVGLSNASHKRTYGPPESPVVQLPTCP